MQTLPRLAATAQGRLSSATAVPVSLTSLAKRWGMADDAWYLAGADPRGSVEHAQKLVVERRLKGARLHWARRHVRLMVALRAVACGDRGQEDWTQMTQQVWQQRGARSPIRLAGSAAIKACGRRDALATLSARGSVR